MKYIENYQAQEEIEKNYQLWKSGNQIYEYSAETQALIEFLKFIDRNAQDTNYVHFVSSQYTIDRKFRRRTQTVLCRGIEQIELILSQCHPYNMVYSPNLFWRTKANRSNHKDNSHLAQINVIAIDIDGIYDGNNPNHTVNTVNQLLEEIGHSEIPIPMPNYVEYGRNARLIYVLSEPIKLGKSPKHRRNMINACLAIMERYCAFIKAVHPELEPEVQAPHKTFRVPGSVNTKNGSHATVHLLKVCEETLTYQEHLDLYCPTIYEQYGCDEKDYVKKTDIKISKKKNIIQLHTESTMLQNRLMIFDKIKNEVARENQEYLAFVWVNTYMALYTDKPYQEIMNELLRFVHSIENFKFPDRKIVSKLSANVQSRKVYRFKNNTLIDYLGIGEEYFKMSETLKKERIEKVAKGETRTQKAERKFQTVRALYLNGMDYKIIMEQTGLSQCTVQNYITAVRKGKDHFYDTTNLENGLYAERKDKGVKRKCKAD